MCALTPVHAGVLVICGPVDIPPLLLEGALRGASCSTITDLWMILHGASFLTLTHAHPVLLSKPYVVLASPLIVVIHKAFDCTQL